MELKDFITKNKNSIISLLLVCFVIYSVSSSENSGLLNQQTLNQWGSSCDYIISSISKTDFVDYDSTIKKSAWLVDLTNIPAGADCLIVSNENINDGQISANSNLYIRTEQVASECSYSLNFESQSIKKITYNYDKKFYYLGTSINNKFDTWKEDNCAGGSAFQGPVEWMLYGANVLFSCIIQSEVAVGIGRISTPEYSFATKICLGNGTDDECALLGTANIGKNLEEVSISGEIGDIGFAKWKGNLDSGKLCPINEFVPYIAVYNNNNKWKITKTEYLTSYNIFNNNYISEIDGCISKDNIDDAIKCFEKLRGGGTSSDHYEVGINSYANLLAEGTNEYIEGIGSLESLIYNEDQQYSSSLKVDREFDIQYPTFSLILDADWLGIYKPSGIPEITEYSSVEGSPRTDGSIQVSVVNKDTKEVGYFIGKMTCPAAVQVSDDSDEISSILPNRVDEKIMSFQFEYPAVTYERDYVCTVRVYDKNDPNREAYCYPIITVNPGASCIDGEMRCSGSYKQACLSNEWINLENCDFGCIQYMEGSQLIAKCKEAPIVSCGNNICEPEKGETAITCPKDCGSPDDCNYNCEIWDVKCLFDESMCKLEKGATGILMFVGLGIGIIIIIWLIFKILTAGAESRGYRPKYFARPYEMMQHPYQETRDMYRRRY